MTMIMGTMPQSPITGGLSAKDPAGSSSTGQLGEGSTNGLLFAQLLGTSLQTNFPGTLSTSGNVTPELGDLAALGTSQTSRGLGVADQLISAGEEVDESSAQGEMQLMNGVAILFSDVRNGAVPAQNAGKTGEAAELLAELQKLVDQDGSLPGSLQEQLRGVLKPAVQKSVEQIAVPETDDTDDVSGEQKASEMLSALLATLNSELKKNPQQVVQKGAADKPLDDTNSKSAAILAVTAVKPEQPVKQEVGAVQLTGEGETSDYEMFKAILTELKPVHAEKFDRSAFQQATAELKPGTSANDMVQAEAEKFRPAAVVAAVQGKPGIRMEESQQPDIETKPVKPETSGIKEVDVVFMEEPPIFEPSQGSSLKQDPAAGIRQDFIRSESIQVLPREGQMLQGAAERPVVETVTREQIVNQVREKIEEHRITADKGQVTIRLNPADLGELRINVRMDEQRLRVEIVAENRTVKDALMENVGSLKEALARQNMDMKQFDVTTGSRQFFNQGFREGRQQEQQFVGQRQATWLMGHVDEAQTTGPVSWQPKKNALLDMMM